MNIVAEYTYDIKSPKEYPDSGGLQTVQIAVDVLIRSSEDYDNQFGIHEEPKLISTLVNMIEVYFDKEHDIRIEQTPEGRKAGICAFMLPYGLICSYNKADGSGPQYWHKIIVGDRLWEYISKDDLDYDQEDFSFEEYASAYMAF